MNCIKHNSLVQHPEWVFSSVKAIHFALMKKDLHYLQDLQGPQDLQDRQDLHERFRMRQNTPVRLEGHNRFSG